jgi:hypothetical protein
MKKVASRPASSSPFTADPFAEDAAGSSLGSSLINRPEAVGSAGLAQNSNFFQKLQLAQNSLRTSQDVDDGLRNPEAFTSVMVSTLDDSRQSRPAERFSPLISAASKTRTGGGGGAVFPQELDIITASGGGGVDSGSAQSSGGFFADFDFEEAPAENLFRVSSQLRVGGREEETKEDDLRFPGTVLEDATTRKIGKPNGSGALTSCTYRTI